MLPNWTETDESSWPLTIIWYIICFTNWPSVNICQEQHCILKCVGEENQHPSLTFFHTKQCFFFKVKGVTTYRITIVNNYLEALASVVSYSFLQGCWGWVWITESKRLVLPKWLRRMKLSSNVLLYYWQIKLSLCVCSFCLYCEFCRCWVCVSGECFLQMLIKTWGRSVL